MSWWRTIVRAGTTASTLLALTVASGCSSDGDRSAGPTPAASDVVASSAAPGPRSTPNLVVRNDLAEVFAQAGTTGTFALHDVTGGQLTVVNQSRAERPYPPASTFKIPHSLIALETGVVADENEKIPYGGKPQRIKEWEQDMGLRDAVRVSNVPVFQEIARRVGPEREREWLRRLGYGNTEIGTVVDRFWLDGPLAISARDQALWLSRLARAELPASAAHQRLVRDILRLEQRDGYTLYGKTGWTTATEPGLGWWVGWVERDDRLYCFALNLDMTRDADAPKRVATGRELLRRLDVLPVG